MKNMAELIDGKKVAYKIKQELKLEVEKLKKNGICYVSDGIDKFKLKADKEYLLGRDLNICLL